MNPNFLLISSPVLLMIILGCFTRYGASIKCYQCNSAKMYDPDGVCDNVLTHPKREEVIVNCTELNSEYKRCRVIVQEVEGETRIIRSCATYPDPKKENKCTDRTGTSKIKMRYCECLGDLCNGASSFTPPLLGLALLATVALFGVSQ